MQDYDTKLINLALNTGEIMLQSGAETYRVQDTMKRILSTTGRDKIEAVALSTLLIVTLPRAEKGPLSMTRGVENRSVNFKKLCAANAMSRGFVSGKISLEEAEAQVAEIYQISGYKPLTCVLGYGMTAGGCSFLFSQSLPDGIAAFFIGTLLGILLHFVGKRKAPYFFASFLGGATAAALASLLPYAFPTLETDDMFIGGIMPLLPGLTMTKAIRDLLEGNFISGNSKMMEAFLIAATIAGGTAVALELFHPLY